MAQDEFGNYQADDGNNNLNAVAPQSGDSVIIGSGAPNASTPIAPFYIDKDTGNVYSNGALTTTGWTIITGGGSGATQVFAGNYGGGVPTATPTTSAATAYDTSNGATWAYYSGAWH